MRRTILVFSFIISVFLTLSADDPTVANIYIQHRSHGDHLEYYPLADQPDVYYDLVNQIIIINGGGEVTYYDVEIASVTTTLTVISSQVNGYYDTIDISTLPQDDYVITIYSPEDHTYEGFFEI